MASNKPLGAIRMGIELDGAKEFTGSVTQITRELKTLESGMRANNQAFKVTGESMETLTKKTDQLETAMNGYDALIKGLEKNKQKYIEQYGAESKQVQKVENDINKATTQYNRYSKELSDTRKRYIELETGLADITNELKQNEQAVREEVNALKKAGDATGAMEREQEGLKKQAELTERAIEAQKEAITRLSTEFGENSTEVKQAEQSLQKFERQGKLTEKALEGISNEADDVQEATADIGGGFEESTSMLEVFKGSLLAGFAMKGIETLLSGLGELGDKLVEVADLGSKFKGSLGLSDAEANTFTNLANEVYSSGLGDSIDEIAENMVLMRQNGIASNDMLKDMTAKATALSKVNGGDVEESMRGVMAITQNLGVSADEAFDLMVKGTQNGLDKTHELGDNMAEYAQLFGQYGLSATDVFGMLDNGMSNGAYNLDKVNDIIKEMGISVSDGRLAENIGSFSDETKKAFDQYQKGGGSVGAVIQSMARDLGNMKNQSEQAALASTMWSALGEDNNLQLIASLGQVNDSYKDVKGSADELVESQKTNSPFDAMKRTAESLMTTVAQGLQPVMADTTTNILNWGKTAQDTLSNVMPNIAEGYKKGMETIQGVINLFTGKGSTNGASPLFKALGLSPMDVANISLQMGEVRKTFENGLKGIQGVFSIIMGDEKGGSKILQSLGLSPENITQITTTITNVKKVLGDGFKAVVDTWQVAWDIGKIIFDELVKVFTEIILPNVMPIIKTLGDAFSKIFKQISDFWNANGKQFMEAFKNFITFIEPVLKVVITLVKGFVDNIIGFVQGMVRVIEGVIKVFTGVFTGDFSKMWEGVKDIFFGGIQTVWNWIQIAFVGRILKGVKGLASGFGGTIKGLWTTVKGFFSEGISKVWGAVINWVKNILERTGALKDGFVNLIKALWSNVKTFFTRGIGDTWNSIVNWVKNMIGKVTNLKRSITDLIKQMWDGAKTETSDFISNLVKWFTELPSKIAKSFRSKMGAIADAFKDAFDKVVSIIKNPVNAVIGGINWVLKFVGGGKLDEWKPTGYAKGTDGHPTNSLATVNDGAGAEMVIRPNGQAFIPSGKNVTMFMEQGTQVIPARQTAELMGKPRSTFAYAKGTGGIGGMFAGMVDKVVDFGKSAFDKVASTLGDVMDWVGKPAELINKVFSKVIDFSGLSHLPKNIMDGLLKKAVESFKDMVGALLDAKNQSNDGSIGNQWGVYRYLFDIAQKTIARFKGMSITSGYREGDPYSHGKRQAIDIAFPASDNGNAGKYMPVADWVFDTFKDSVGYVITQNKVRDRVGNSGAGKNSAWHQWTDGDHYDHLHINGMLEPSSANPSGAGAERWRSTVETAMKMVGFPSGKRYVDRMIAQIQSESGGNPNAIQNGYTDKNSIEGNLARGLLQVIPPTFDAYKMPGYGNIMNPLDNILASLRYIMATYGTGQGFFNNIGMGHGYANGGLITTEQLAMVGEGNKPEIVIPLDQSKRSRAMYLLALASQKLGVTKNEPKIVNSGSDNSMLVQLLLKQNQLLEAILMKDTNMYVDGEQLDNKLAKYRAKTERDRNRDLGLI